eukprot:6473325-Amphidinium_carterae.4
MSGKDVIVESKPGYFRNTIIQAGMEKGSAVGTASVKQEIAEEDDEYLSEVDHRVFAWVCRRLQFASPRICSSHSRS